MARERIFRRWDRSQLRQHQLEIVSFTLLCATGLPLRYAQSKTSQTLAAHLGGAGTAAVVHRIAAVMLIAVTVWHAIYLFRRWRRRTLRLTMLPAWKDVQDVVGVARYLFGLQPHEPQYARYNFIEKFEYLAVLWGSVVMIATGFILWFPVVFARLVGGVGLEVSKTIHGYEALLAAVSIAVWHMYHAHLRMDVFPMNRMWLTGTLTETEMRHHHPLELERLQAEELVAATALPGAPPEQDHESRDDAEAGPESAGAAGGDAVQPGELRPAAGQAEPGERPDAVGAGDDDPGE